MARAYARDFNLSSPGLILEVWYICRMKLRDNKWGFDLKLDNPFKIFWHLRDIAIEAVGEENVFDLSRGNPGFGFAPSVAGRELYALLLEIDVLLNNPDRRFAYERHTFEEIWEEISAHVHGRYTLAHAKKLLTNLTIFIEHLARASERKPYDVLYETFKYATVSGGPYISAPGEDIIRSLVACHYADMLKLDFDYRDVVFVQGVSHGIGLIFDVLTDPEVGFLQAGDTVILQSPAYMPYNIVLENRGLRQLPLEINPATGELENLEDVVRTAPDSTKLMVLINPHNPTGFRLSDESMRRLADFADKRDILIVTDDVYIDFFPGMKNMLHYAPKRTIMFGGRSKIERATGIRFGDIIVTKEGQKYIAERLFGGRLRGQPDLMTLFSMSKGPTHMDAALYHTTFVTGPSQFMGAAHMILGGEDRGEYLRRVREASASFYDILGIPYNGNLYYATFDLYAVDGARRGDCQPEALFCGLAEQGVVYLPVHLFFSEQARGRKDLRSFARASLPNLQPEQVAEAARRTKEYISRI